MSDGVRGNSSRGPADTENPNNIDNEGVRGDPWRDLPEWLEEFKENLVDDSVPEHRDASSSTHELPSEPRAKVVLGKHSIFTHFPKDRNYNTCLRTKIPRASCGKRTGTVVPRADNFGNLTAADDKILSEGCESRNNHRYAVVVQDLATQWIQSHRCKTQTSQETQKSLQKFLEPTRKPKVIYTDNSPEFGKYCEDLAGNHSSSKPHRSETSRIAEKEERRIKEGTSAVQSGLDEKWWADSMACYCYLRNIQDLLSDGKTPYERRFGVPFNGPVTPFGAMVEYHPISVKDLSRLQQFIPKVLQHKFMRCTRSEFGKETSWSQTLRNWNRWKHMIFCTPHFKTHRVIMVKLEMISGPFQAILFTVNTWNPESNSTCREKHHFRFH